MKINVNFSELNNAVDLMGASNVVFDVGKTKFEDIDIDTILGTTGQEIKLEELEFSDGLLSYKGRQVLLYIPDHGNKIEKAIEDSVNGNRFHVADCETLNTMKNKKRFDRYIVINNLSGDFKISGVNYRTREEVTDNIRLHVCKNCLKFINYYNYKNSKFGEKKVIFEDFSIDGFFENYSTLFRSLPKNMNKIYSSVYTSDWEIVSKNYRTKMNYICESCNTSFNENKKLLHTHHINGVKDDNKDINLKAVCIDCHRKEPNHTHVMMNHKNLSEIYRLRRIQNKSITKNWDDVFKLADLALHGYLNLLKEFNSRLLPEVGYILTYQNEEILFDLAWTNTKIKTAIVVNVNDSNRNIPGWKIITLGEALSKINKK